MELKVIKRFRRENCMVWWVFHVGSGSLVIRMLVEAILSGRLFFPSCWSCILMTVGYLLVSLLQLVFTSSFRGGSFSDALPPGSVVFGKDTDIYGASPFAQRPCLRGWLSHQIPRVLYRSSTQPMSPLLLPLQAPLPGSRWGGRKALSWRVRSQAEHRRAWKLVSTASSPAFQQLSWAS